MLADLLVAGGVAAHAVAGVERVAAEEGVAGAFEAEVLGDVDDFEAVLGEPAAVVGLFALPLAVAEAGDARTACLSRIDHRGVGGEDQVGQAFDGFEQRDLGTGIDDVRVQGVPLLNGHGVIGLPRHVHPRIDFVVDAVEVRRAHQDVGLGFGHSSCADAQIA